MGEEKYTCVKNHCNSCGWEGCYCEMLIDDRIFSKEGIPKFVCPGCKGINITYARYFEDYLIPEKKDNRN